jgi:hypothetical protein
MAVVSSTVNSGELATATQFNNLRTDAVGSTGHDHGSGQGNATISATTFDGTATVSGAWNFTGAVGIDSSVDADVTDFNLASSNNAAGAITLHANGGTSETIKIHADLGTSVTEGAESITILSDAGGVGIRSTANLANAVNLTVDGGTTSTMTLFNDQGTAATEGAASIQLLSDVGGINVKSGLNASNAILLTADGGTSETIVIHADQGTGTGSIELLSDAGGIELDAGTDIILDAGGTDIFLKDDGTLFATLKNNSGELQIQSSSSGTTAMNFSGANVTFLGTVTIGSAEISEAELEILDGATVTTDELNLIDGGTSRGTTAVASGDGILINDGGTMRMTNVDTVSTYFSSHNVGGGNIVTTGALDSGSITSGFGNINNGSSTITTTGAADLGATTVDSLTSTGDFTTTGQATDWDLIDNTASALSFDASGKAGILEIVTTNNSEAVKMSGDLDVDGTANLDAVDIDGAVQIDEAVTVGVDDTGREVVFHGDTASSELRWDTDADALVLDCGAVDAAHLVFRSTGSVSHGITSGFPGSGSVGNTDYLDIRKANATIGGAKFSAIAENAALTTVMRFQSIGGTPNATKTTSGSGLVQFDVMENDGSNGVEAITVSGGNVFGISAQGLGCRFLVDEDGDLYSVTSAQTFDEYDDLALVDSYDSIRNDYSEFATEHEDQLIKLGVLGDRVSAGGMTNTSQLQRLHNGAIRQLAGLLEDAMTRLDSAENKLLALEAR